MAFRATRSSTTSYQVEAMVFLLFLWAAIRCSDSALRLAETGQRRPLVRSSPTTILLPLRCALSRVASASPSASANSPMVDLRADISSHTGGVLRGRIVVDHHHHHQRSSRSRSRSRLKSAAPSPTAMSYSDDMAAFYDAWVGREEQIVANLMAALALPPGRRSDALALLVDAAVAHVAAYYEHKSRLADRDVVAALDPRWLNPLERTFLWAWGWKPALMFRFVDTGVGVGLGPEQRRALEELRAATTAAEREVDLRVVAVQESLAEPRVLAALRRQPPRNGNTDEAVAAVVRSLRVLLAAADALRDRTLRAGERAQLAPASGAPFTGMGSLWWRRPLAFSPAVVCAGLAGFPTLALGIDQRDAFVLSTWIELADSCLGVHDALLQTVSAITVREKGKVTFFLQGVVEAGDVLVSSAADREMQFTRSGLMLWIGVGNTNITPLCS